MQWTNTFHRPSFRNNDAKPGLSLPKTRNMLLFKEL
jgi:hypothetical protein